MEPKISKTAHIAKESVIIGTVSVGDEATVMYYSVLRGDNGPVTVGDRTNIQEHCCLHTDPGHEVWIGNDVTVGHGCILHGCRIGSETLIGMGSVIMNGAQIGEHCLIGAGSLVTENTVIPDGYLAMGRPARPVRELKEKELEMIHASAAEYVKTGRKLLG